MNAISVTMVKGTDSKPMHDYAFRATIAMVTLSWIGWQFLLAGGGYFKLGATGRALSLVEGGLVLLMYSLFLLLRVKRREALPTRESAQLFFGAFLALLPLITWGMWMFLTRLISAHDKHQHSDTVDRAFLYASVIISVIYFVMILIWLQTNVTSYDYAKPGSWAYRFMRRLESILVDPYVKK